LKTDIDLYETLKTSMNKFLVEIAKDVNIQENAFNSGILKHVSNNMYEKEQINGTMEEVPPVEDQEK
jgi:hypothetical protein